MWGLMNMNRIGEAITWIFIELLLMYLSSMFATFFLINHIWMKFSIYPIGQKMK